jgi:hypothetical protein
MFVEASRNAPKLLFGLDYKSVPDIVCMLHNKPLDFAVKLGNFAHAQRNLTLSFSRPHQGSIEGFGCQIGG